MNTISKSKRMRGLTLLELLLAVAIIVFLVALSYTMFGALHQRAIAFQCMNNMRSFGQAILVYAGEHNGIPECPPGGGAYYSFSNLLMPLDSDGKRQPRYLDKQLNCPLPKRTPQSRSDLSYGGNVALALYFPSLKGIPAPMSRIVLAAEIYTGSGFWSLTHFETTVGYKNGKVIEADPPAFTPQWHGTESQRGLHIFCLDGHVELLRAVDNVYSKSPAQAKIVNGAYNDGYFYTEGDFWALKAGRFFLP